VDAFRVQPVRRLVEDEQLGVAEQRAREPEALAHPEGVGLDPPRRDRFELDELEHLIAAAPALVAPGGVIAVISFHSLEDRLAKRALRDRALWRPLTKKPIVPSDAEMGDNPRSRSAKLRTAMRLDAAESFDGEDRDSGEWGEPEVDA
jgi:hypothetical protein